MYVDADKLDAVRQFKKYVAESDLLNRVVRNIKEQIDTENEIAKTPLSEVFKDLLKDCPYEKTIFLEAIKCGEYYRSERIKQGDKPHVAMTKGIWYVCGYFKQIEEEYQKRLNEVVREKVFIVRSPFVFNKETGKYETFNRIG